MQSFLWLFLKDKKKFAAKLLNFQHKIVEEQIV